MVVEDFAAAVDKLESWARGLPQVQHNERTGNCRACGKRCGRVGWAGVRCACSPTVRSPECHGHALASSKCTYPLTVSLDHFWTVPALVIAKVGRFLLTVQHRRNAR